WNHAALHPPGWCWWTAEDGVVRCAGGGRCVVRTGARDGAGTSGKSGGVVLLQRLVEYANASEDVVPPFYAYKPVRWILDIDEDGNPILGELTDTADKADPQRKFGVVRQVPAVTRTVGVAPALAVDTGEYVFGWVSPGSKPDRVAKQAQTYRDLVETWAEADPDGPGAAIAAFYRKGYDKRYTPGPGWSRGDLIGIRVNGTFAAETPSAR